MGENTTIEWTDHSFNGWIGCKAISPGCDHCYAEAYAKRVGRDFSVPTLTSDANWALPLKWDAKAKADGVRRRVFAFSLGDVFDNQAPQAWRDRLWALIERTPNLDWLLLTKRIGNARDMLPEEWSHSGAWPAHVRLGATLVNQEEVDRDLPKLFELGCPNFISLEPLLGPITLFHNKPSERMLRWYHPMINSIHWVIAGGESGHRARAPKPDWFRQIRDQCAQGGVPFLFKQWGEWGPTPFEIHRNLPDAFTRLIEDNELAGTAMVCADGVERIWPMLKVGKKKAGRILDGKTYDQLPGHYNVR